MLAGDNPDIPELQEILADIVGEDLRAGEVITRLRALLKRGETRLLPLALNEVIEDVLHLLRSDLVARGVTAESKLAERLPDVPGDEVQLQDRKSTRLNSSHVAISYAVFCLKKKNYTHFQPYH